MEIVSPASFLWTIRNPGFPDLTPPAKILAVGSYRSTVASGLADNQGMLFGSLHSSRYSFASDPLAKEIPNAPLGPCLGDRIQHTVGLPSRPTAQA